MSGRGGGKLAHHKVVLVRRAALQDSLLKHVPVPNVKKVTTTATTADKDLPTPIQQTFAFLKKRAPHMFL